MLRYYEKEKLLIPAFIDLNTGYRSYETKQLVELSDYECKHMTNLYSRVIEHKPVNWTAKFAGGKYGK